MAALKRNSIFIFAAVATGLISIIFGLGVVRAGLIFQQMTAERPMLVFALCPVGFAIIVFLTRKVFPGAQGSGIPQATATVAMGTNLATADSHDKAIKCRWDVTQAAVSVRPTPNGFDWPYGSAPRLPAPDSSISGSSGPAGARVPVRGG